MAALALRIYLNRGQTWGTPDERTYSLYGLNWRPGKKYRWLIQRYLDGVPDIPPTRYGFFALCSVITSVLHAKDSYKIVTWIATTSGALATIFAYSLTNNVPATLLVGSAPLSLLLGRRALQDTFAALTVLLGLLAVQIQSVELLIVSVTLAVATREALLLYLPGLYGAWVVATWREWAGMGCLIVGVVVAVLGYHTLGGRKLAEVLRTLRQPTDYVRRLQSGAPHRVLVDLVLASPVAVVGGAAACAWVPSWLPTFVGLALGVHAFVTPKNVRFLLVVDLAIRVMCAWLPGPWNWIVLGLCLVSDALVYRSFLLVRDPVTYNLVVASKMYSEK